MPTGSGEILPPEGTYTEYRKEHARSLSGTSLVFLEKERNLSTDTERTTWEDRKKIDTQESPM